jgi:Protein of Unknown function (DUF2784)
VRLLADLILILHVAYVAFVVGGLGSIWVGAWRGWRWVRNAAFRLLHLAAIAVVAVEALIGMACPLTEIEDWLRPATGPSAGFVQRWLQALLYWDLPGWAFTLAYLCFAAAVAVTYIAFPPVLRRGSRHPGIGSSRA